MRARLLVPLAGDPMWSIGDEVEGDDAVRLCEAGLAVPIVEETVETADAKPVVEKRSKKTS